MNKLTLEVKIEALEEEVNYHPMNSGMMFNCGCGCGGDNYTSEEWDKETKELIALEKKLEELKQTLENYEPDLFEKGNEIEEDMIMEIIAKFFNETLDVMFVKIDENGNESRELVDYMDKWEIQEELDKVGHYAKGICEEDFIELEFYSGKKLRFERH